MQDNMAQIAYICADDRFDFSKELKEEGNKVYSFLGANMYWLLDHGSARFQLIETLKYANGRNIEMTIQLHMNCKYLEMRQKELSFQAWLMGIRPWPKNEEEQLMVLSKMLDATIRTILEELNYNQERFKIEFEYVILEDGKWKRVKSLDGILVTAN